MLNVGDIFTRNDGNVAFYVYIGIRQNGLGIGDYEFAQVKDPLDNVEVREILDGIASTIAVPKEHVESGYYSFVRNLKDGGVEKVKKVLKPVAKRKRVVRKKKTK